MGSAGGGLLRVEMRIDRRRAVNVTADVDTSKGNTQVLNTALKKEILPDLRKKFPGVYWDFEGEQSEHVCSIISSIKIQKPFVRIICPPILSSICL